MSLLKGNYKFYCRKIIHYPNDLGPEKLKYIDEEETAIYKSMEEKVQIQRVEKSFSPIKEFIPEDSDYESK